MRFLILGCNGMAGHMISLYLKEKGYDVTGFARKKSKFIKTICGDALDINLLEKIIKEGNYDTIVNCIGLLNKAAEKDKDQAVFINSYLPHFLAKVTKNMDTQIIHMSTDCVFSGKKGNYTENDFKDGETFYDRSKALGEIIDNKNITLRNSIIGPDIKKEGIGLLNWFMQQKEEITGFTKAIWTGQTTLQLAKTIEFISKEKSAGLFNMVPNKNISKYELLKLFNKYLRNNKIKIIPSDKLVVDKTLLRTNYSINYIIPDYETMVKELAEWIYNHKDIYSHYYQ